MSRHWSTRAALLTAAVACTIGGRQALAQGKAAAGAVQHHGKESKEQAIASLREMSQTLGSAESLRFQARSLRPMKLEDGRWVTLVGEASVARQGKDKLVIDTSGDFFPFRLFYDGKTMTAFAPEDHVYAQEDAPGTIDQMLERAQQRGQAAFVFRDLVSANPFAGMSRGLENAAVVGTSTIDGVETEHLAVHGAKLDWEIWIGTKDHLPRMATLTDLGDARKPTHTVQFSGWEVNGSIPPDAFTFNAPPDAKKVPFRSPKQVAASGHGAASTTGTGTGGGAR